MGAKTTGPGTELKEIPKDIDTMYGNITSGKNQTTKDSVAFRHPAIFPEQLAQDHILSWSNEGDAVLDPFMGSGTTAKNGSTK